MTLKHALVVSIAAALLAGAPLAVAGDATKVVAKADLQWKDMGNGIAAAPVSGDMDTGASRFFLKYPAGLVTPNHHHDANHHATLVSGEVTLTVDGKAHRLGPGSYFVLTDKVPHVAKVEGGAEAVFYIEADGPWTVVMDP